MNEKCKIVRDLMPLVLDEVASEESCSFVEKHLQDCGECRLAMEDMRRDFDRNLPELTEEDTRFIRLCRRLRRNIRWRNVIAVLALAVMLGLMGRYSYYQMYENQGPLKLSAEDYRFLIDETGCLRISYAVPSGYLDLGMTEFGLFNETTHYLSPNRSAWPNLFQTGEKEVVNILDYVVQDGKLMYKSSQHGVVYDENAMKYVDQWTVSYTPVEALYIGEVGDSNAFLLYQAGDELPSCGEFGPHAEYADEDA